MRVYRYLFWRIANGVAILVVFSLLCFTIVASIPPAALISPYMDLPFIRNLPETSPWDPNYSWLNFWMDERMDSSFLEMGRCVFYITHMFSGDYGSSWRTYRSVNVDLSLYGLPSVLLLVVAIVIALWMILCGKLWNSNICYFRTANNRRRGLVLSGLSVMLFVVTGLLVAYFVSIACPFLFRNIIFWSLHGSFSRENFNLYDPRYFALPAFGLAGAILIGWKLAMKIQAQQNHSLSKEYSNAPHEIRQVIIQMGLRTGFFCAFVLPAIIFVEVIFPYRGLGRCFVYSLWANDFSVTNAIFFLSGITIIVVSFSVEIIYGLLQFGPYPALRIWFARFELTPH